METQQHWSTRAVGRPIPCLLGLFSLVILMAHADHPDGVPPRAAARKAEPTVSDVLAAVQRHLWAARKGPSRAAAGLVQVPDQLLDASIVAAGGGADGDHEADGADHPRPERSIVEAIKPPIRAG
jgi:hypothetical protein